MTAPPPPAKGEDSNLGRRIVVGAGWMVAMRWIDRAVGLASVAVLARLLLPEHFGIVGYAMLVISLLELVSGMSIDDALIREREADRDYYSAAWTMNVLRGIVLAVLLLALARPAAEFFHDGAVEAVVFAVAAIPLLQGLENVGTIDFRKQLRFDLEFRFILLPRIVSTIVTIVLAFALRSYWALVAGQIVRVALKVAMSYWLHPFRARFTFARIPEIFRFSRWMILQNLVAGLNGKLPGFVIGHEMTSSALAYFNMGREISELSGTEIRAPIRRALYPGLAKIAGNRSHLGYALVESVSMMALVTLPIPLGTALVAGDLVPLFLGPQWQPVIGVLQILCIGAAINAIGTNSSLAYLILNRSHLTAAANVVRLILLAIAMIVLAPSYGLMGVAYAIAGVNAVMLVADYVLAPWRLGLEPTRFVAATWRPVVASLAMCVAVWLAQAAFPPATDFGGHAWSLARSVSVGAVTYAGCALALWFACGRPEGAERRLISTLARYGFPLRRI